MNAPQRIQRKRTKGWLMPESAVYVGRPSRWGNPYRVQRAVSGGWRVRGRGSTSWSADDKHPWTKREASQVAFEQFQESCFQPNSFMAREAEIHLPGHDLACWCPLEDAEGRPVPCHADVLLEIANSEVAQ